MTNLYTCPWCGTNYLEFQTNCSNCGGPLVAGTGANAADDLPTPPPAPRSISGRYAWRLLWSDAWAIIAFILGILGTVFALVGVGLTLGIVTAFVGIPFLFLGLGFLVVSLPILAWRYQAVHQVIMVLREGAATRGKIVGTDEQYAVSVNGRHPWIIRYEFELNGLMIQGRVTTLNEPTPQISAGKVVRVLYLLAAPSWNSLYPHP